MNASANEKIPAKERIIVALDVPHLEAAENIMDQLAGCTHWVKIGLQLFIKEGLAIVAAAQKRGFRVFLDLKLHDIPNTMANAVQSACALGVDMLSIHIMAGITAIDAACNAAKNTETRLVGITVLTSMDTTVLKSINVYLDPKEYTVELAEAGVVSGLRALVCGPQEISAVRRRMEPTDITLVVPGIRTYPSSDDQKRTGSARSAIRDGADYLVIGRPILTAPSPRLAFEEIVSSISK